MVVTIILGQLSRHPCHPTEPGSQDHIPTEQSLRRCLPTIKAWLPNTVCIPIFSVSQSENIKLLITPSKSHKSPAEHLSRQNQTSRLTSEDLFSRLRQHKSYSHTL